MSTSKWEAIMGGLVILGIIGAFALARYWEHQEQMAMIQAEGKKP